MSYVSKRDREHSRPVKRSMGNIKLSKAMSFMLRDAYDPAKAIGVVKPSY